MHRPDAYWITELNFPSLLGISAALAVVALPISAPRAEAQLAELLGPHETETIRMKGEIPGTGRIGGIVMDNYTYIYVANQDEGLWKIHPSGEVELFATGFYGSGSGAMMRSGDLLWSSYASHEIFRIERDGTVHPFVSEGLNGPVGITVVPNGDVFVVNYNGDYVSRVTPDGEVSQFARDDRMDGPNGITSDNDGNLYVANLNNTIVLKITPDGEISEIARLPGRSNAHVAFAGGALYVTQLWSHVVLRVEMDGSYQVVAGDGTPGFEDGPAGVATTAFPNGITATRSGSYIYFNTMHGNMIAGHLGSIDIRRLHAPSPNRAFVNAYEQGGLEALRSKFDMARNLREATVEQLVPALYGVGRRLLSLQHSEGGIAIIEWAAEVDPDRTRAHITVGNAHSVQGDRDVAIEHYEKALELKPDDEGLRLRLEGVRTFRRE